MPSRLYPALDIAWPVYPDQSAIDRALAELDDFSPAAVEELAAGIRVFFGDENQRDRASEALRVTTPGAALSALSVSDEAWAERSQAALLPVRIGRLIVSPPWSPPVADFDAATDVSITILPSMGFGTGHHASTRLCLRHLQTLPLASATVLDVGTGSGVLAIAASRLGAGRVLAIDLDDDALTSARENLELNGVTDRIEVSTLDLTTEAASLTTRFDAITANLTGAMLMRYAGVLTGWLQRPGQLIVSGFQTHEAADVGRSFEDAGLVVEAREDEDTWVALRVTAR